MKEYKPDDYIKLTAKNFRELEKTNMTIGDLKKSFERRKKCHN